MSLWGVLKLVHCKLQENSLRITVLLRFSNISVLKVLQAPLTNLKITILYIFCIICNIGNIYTSILTFPIIVSSQILENRMCEISEWYRADSKCTSLSALEDEEAREQLRWLSFRHAIFIFSIGYFMKVDFRQISWLIILNSRSKTENLWLFQKWSNLCKNLSICYQV